MNKEPALNPNNQQKIGSDQINSTNKTTINEINGGVMVNEFVKGKTFEAVPEEINPYDINGGGYFYNIFYKNISHQIAAKNPLQAAQKGFFKINQKFNNINSARIGVQRINKNRENQTHIYQVRKNSVKNPNYTHKITFKKI